MLDNLKRVKIDLDASSSTTSTAADDANPADD